MLYELYAENFALMTGLRLQLGEGMNALTGETGAGKSLIVDALSLLIGGRGNDSLIRSGCDKCRIEGTFLPPFPDQTRELLEENGIELEDDLILTRELIRGGRSLARINGRSVNISFLRSVGHTLVNLHGQKEHMLLLEDAHQLLLLDSYAQGSAPLLAVVREKYNELCSARRALDEYEQNIKKNSQGLEELAAVIRELEDACLRQGEDDELAAEANILSHGEKLYQAADSAVAALRDGDKALDNLSLAAAALKDIASLDPSAAELSQRSQDLFYEAEDIYRDLTGYRDRIDLDPYRLEAVESRLDQLGRLKKKYKCTLCQLIDLLEEAKAEEQELQYNTASPEKLGERLHDAQEAYNKAAAALSNLRRKAAIKLGDAISKELAILSMPNAVFRVDLPANEPGPRGNEHAEFMICPNPGEPFNQVSHTASGGELSRIVLGMKVIFAQSDYVPTLIFDEVDTGLSGKALVSVAERIALVGKTSQTIVVTHNAVMAAAAAHQILIEKHQEGDRTVSAAHMLNEEERVVEIARMIAGDKAGDVTIAQAKEMLEKMDAAQL